MKIAYVITRSDSIGGAQVHVQYLAQAFSKQGHNVKVFVGGSGPFIKVLKKNNIPFVSLNHLVQPISPIQDIKSYKELKYKLRNYSPDIIALHSSKAGWIGRLVGEGLNIPTIFTAHGWAFTEGKNILKRGLFLFAEKMVGSLAKKIITVSDFDRKLALKYKIADPDKLNTIYNGVNDVNNKLLANLAQSYPKIVMVARFDNQKNHKVLLQALTQIKDLEWSLELIGEGPLEEEVKRLAKKLELMDRIEFMGFRDDVDKRLSKAQIFALSTKWEGLPISIIEAIRASLPVVATDVGGISEIVDDNENGYLIQNNPEEIACKLSKLIQNHNLRGQMGRNGRKLFLDKLTYEIMHKKTLEAYKSVMH